MIEVEVKEKPIESLEDAMDYIAGYCRKHKHCDEYCRLFNSETGQCFLYDDQPPCDWIITKEGSE